MSDPKYETSLRLYNEACNAMDAGAIDNAISLFEQSAQLYPHFKTYQHLGKCLFCRKRLAEAVLPLAAATALNRQGIAPTLLAEVFLKLNEPTKAKEMLDLAIERQPEYKKALSLRPLVDQAAAAWDRQFDLDE